jgi:Domain of unknown function (DUF4159)/Aerotolerance regulator N-terminal
MPFASFFAGLSFGAPLLLWTLAALPIIYWLLRVTPPAPRRIVFPPLRLLFGLRSTEETPARTPWWLLLMRLIAAAIAIVALAEPLYDPTPVAAGRGPLVMVVDNGWTSAANWDARQAALNRGLTGATRDKRQVLIVPTAEAAPATTQFLDPANALKTVQDTVPRPWLPDRAKALAALQSVKFAQRPQIMWFSDGLAHGNDQAFADGLAKIGTLSVFEDPPEKAPLAMRPPDNETTGFGITLVRVAADIQRDGRVAALDSRGQIVETAPYHFGLRSTEAKTTIALPLELRNDTTRIAVMGHDSAGAVQLIDARFRRRPVGLVSGGNADVEQPLLSDVYYLERALSPYAEIHKGTIEQVLDSGVAVVVLADIGELTSVQHDRIAKFVEDGGVLLRFGGPKLAAHSDDLVPVKLREGERLMGSAMTWASPQHLTPFADNSPFRGLTIAPDVTVSRQVLAEPSVELGDHTWARLTDGTPLVTGAARGRGWIVLFHVAASPGWSTLPLSGLYVDMLRRVVELSEGVQGGAAEAKTGTFPPYETLDGFGHLGKAYPEATPLRASEIENATIGPLHPPGLYGVQGALVALNAFGTRSPMTALRIGRTIFAYTGSVAQELKWPLLELALIILMIDALISLALRGYMGFRLPRFGRGAARAATVTLIIIAASMIAHTAMASEPAAVPKPGGELAKDEESALETRLAYVITGDPDVDAMSKAGLFGLGLELRARTAYEPAEPVGVDLENDDLSFYPLIYWPMTPVEKDLSPAAVAKVDQFMRQGGTILFDTRDSPLTGVGSGAASPGEQTLRRLLARLDIPPLEPAPADHVLTRTFYLLKEFPGRWSGGQVWVEALPPDDPNRPPDEKIAARGGDGVSPIIMGGNDWAAAWARDESGNPIAAVVPGGEEQREMAIRFGINVVIYAMTGNYKTDQVHVPALLQRLGK